MDNMDALITNAMLASYLYETKTDYLGLIEPFVVKLLPDKKNDLINIESISNELHNNYGFDIKIKVVEKILHRLCKKSIVKSEYRSSEKKFYVNKVLKKDKFDNRITKIKLSVSNVIDKLTDYISENYSVITKDQSQKMFIGFLQDYNYESYSSVDNLRRIQSTVKYNSNNFRVAKFIINEYESKNGCYNDIKEIQIGYFAAIALYYFCNSDISDNPLNLIKNTLIILDTRVLIDALGLNRNLDAKSMGELISLIKINGGKLCTFTYYVDELEGIIHKYIHDSNARLSLDLDLFRREHKNDVEIEVYRRNLKSKINDVGIQIIDKPNYSELVHDQNWHIDDMLLQNTMLSLVSYDGGASDNAFQNDFDSLQAVSYYKYRNEKFGDNKAIFVTANVGIVQAAKKTISKKIFKDDVDIVISDIDLTAVLWLANFNEKSDLPDIILLENAYAAIQPSKPIIDGALRIINQNLKSKNEEIRNNAFLIRYDENLLSDIADLTNNDEKALDGNFYNQLTSRIYNRTYKQVMSDISSETRDKIEHKYKDPYEKKIGELEQREVELKQRHKYLTEKENELNQKDADINRFKSKFATLEYKNDKLNKENNDLKNDLSNIENSIINKSKKISNKFCSCLYIFVLAISFFIMLFILYQSIRFVIDSISNQFSFSNITNQCLSIIGTLATFIPMYIHFAKFIRKKLNSLDDFIYNNLYNFLHK